MMVNILILEHLKNHIPLQKILVMKNLNQKMKNKKKTKNYPFKKNKLNYHINKKFRYKIREKK